jgi:hypothetical protein
MSRNPRALGLSLPFVAPKLSFAGRLASGVDEGVMSDARSRVERGEDPEKVRQETGWFKGVDARWRFEINDRDARLINLRSEGGRAIRATWLSEVLEHDALFSAYPSLQNMDVQIDIGQENRPRARFSPGTPGDALSFGRTPEIEVVSFGEAPALSALLHEVQHAIQVIEGFAAGGSPMAGAQEIAARPYGDVANFLSALERFGGVDTSEFAPSQLRDVEPVAYIESWRLPRSVLDIHITQADVDWLGELGYNFSAGVEVAGVMEVLADAAQKDIRDGQAGGLSSYEQYRRLAGEVEARNVEARQGMTDAERLAVPPAATADVGDEDLILVFGSDGPRARA